MAERPGILRGFRAADGLALFGCAAVLLAADAGAASVTERGASDPSAVEGALVWDGAGHGVLRAERTLRSGRTAHHLGVLRSPLPGRDPALGGRLLAWREESVIRILRRADLVQLYELEIEGVDALAVSDRWLAVRTRGSDGDRILVLPVAGGEARVVVASGRRADVSRPVLDGDRLVYAVTSARQSRIDVVGLPGGTPQTIRRSRFHELSNPSLLGDRLIYVRRTQEVQQLVLGSTAADERVLAELPSTSYRDRGYEPGRLRGHGKPLPKRLPARSDEYLWATALVARAAYVSVVPVTGGVTRTRLLRVKR
jgi:hypothetical protein